MPGLDARLNFPTFGPPVDLSTSFIHGNAVALLNLGSQDGALAFGLFHVDFGELVPLFVDLAPYLVPRADDLLYLGATNRLSTMPDVEQGATLSEINNLLSAGIQEMNTAFRDAELLAHLRLRFDVLDALLSFRVQITRQALELAVDGQLVDEPLDARDGRAL